MKKKNGKIMRIYSEDKLRQKLSVLRMGKMMNQLNDSGLIELTTCELLLEHFCIEKLKDIELIRNIKL
jgi:hypothetical protein